MPEYINHNNYAVHLIGPDGKEIILRPRQKRVLGEYFERYRTRGFIKLVNESTPNKRMKQPQSLIRNKVILGKTKTRRQEKKETPDQSQLQEERSKLQERKKARQEARKAVRVSRARSIIRQERAAPRQRKRSKVVGRRVNVDANRLLQSNLKNNIFPISNNIGIGILSYNRADCLKRLVNSILTNTDLSKTTLFISDDASTDKPTVQYLNDLSSNHNIVVIKNSERLGIAGNSNRLIRCLSRFAYGMILNDDVEVLRKGWDTLYHDAMIETGMHHFSYRQVGVYGAGEGKLQKRGNLNLRVVDEKPHGAVLAFSREMLVKCGYFDEAYGLYGMEHVDWSQKAWEFELQNPGFWDVDGSELYFKIHKDTSAMEDRSTHLREGRKIFAKRTYRRIGPTERSRLPEISYVIPFRNTGREKCILAAVNNIRAQRYPVVHIIVVEQDANTKINLDNFNPVTYCHVTAQNPLFNKSLAFNTGVSKVITPTVVLHDADLLVQGNYTRSVARILEDRESCHLGSTVVYADKQSTDRICDLGKVDDDINCDRVVGYFEGGSVGCTIQAYWRVGAFCQDYWGYGCEDCDFYARLSGASDWKEDRIFDFLHLWHGRVPYWNEHHETNKIKEKNLVVLGIEKRVKMQHKRLVEQGWGNLLKRHAK